MTPVVAVSLRLSLTISGGGHRPLRHLFNPLAWLRLPILLTLKELAFGSREFPYLKLFFINVCFYIISFLCMCITDSLIYCPNVEAEVTNSFLLHKEVVSATNPPLSIALAAFNILICCVFILIEFKIFSFDFFVKILFT